HLVYILGKLIPIKRWRKSTKLSVVGSRHEAIVGQDRIARGGLPTFSQKFPRHEVMEFSSIAFLQSGCQVHWSPRNKRQGLLLCKHQNERLRIHITHAEGV